jgi:hypothetical protein
LVFVLTPRYLNSEWCVRELRLFHDKVASAAGAGANLFKIIKTPVERTAEPAEVQAFQGYEFFRETPAGKPSEFYPSRSEDSEEGKAFYQKVDDVARDLKQILATRVSSPDAPPMDGAKIVYLAETTGDVKVARDNVRRELGQHGYRVVPDRALPLAADELVPLIEADLGQACLTVHPVGARYGFIPEGESRSIVELQIDRATTRNGGSQHVIWVAPEAMPLAEPRQEQFLEKLRRVYTERLHTELLEQKPLEVLKTRVAEKLQPRKAPARAPTPNLRIYLICELADLPAVKPLEEYLRTQGFGVTRPLLEGDQQELLQDHREMLVCCDAVLVYYGSPRPAWLRAKQRDLWKAAGWGRTRPMLGQAIFAAPPAAAGSEDAGDDFLVLDAGAGPVSATLMPFLAQIRTAMGAPQ